MLILGHSADGSHLSLSPKCKFVHMSVDSLCSPFLLIECAASSKEQPFSDFKSDLLKLLFGNIFW